MTQVRIAGSLHGVQFPSKFLKLKTFWDVGTIGPETPLLHAIQHGRTYEGRDGVGQLGINKRTGDLMVLDQGKKSGVKVVRVR